MSTKKKALGDAMGSPVDAYLPPRAPVGKKFSPTTDATREEPRREEPAPKRAPEGRSWRDFREALERYRQACDGLVRAVPDPRERARLIALSDRGLVGEPNADAERMRRLERRALHRAAEALAESGE